MNKITTLKREPIGTGGDAAYIGCAAAIGKGGHEFIVLAPTPAALEYVWRQLGFSAPPNHAEVRVSALVAESTLRKLIAPNGVPRSE